MCNEEPTINPNAVFCVKETCAILSVCGKTLTKFRKCGLISPVNPDERNFRYTGSAIRALWRKVNRIEL